MKDAVKEINRVVVDLVDWSHSYPTGSVAFYYDEPVASEWCDTVEEFKEFFEGIKPNLCEDAILEVRMDMTDLNDSCKHDSCTDIIGFALDIRAAFYEVTGGAL